MADGEQRDRWQHTSLVAAITANGSRDPKLRPKPFLPSDFDPYQRATAQRRKRDEHIRVPIDFLKIFVGRK